MNSLVKDWKSLLLDIKLCALIFAEKRKRNELWHCKTFYILGQKKKMVELKNGGVFMHMTGYKI